MRCERWSRNVALGALGVVALVGCGSSGSSKSSPPASVTPSSKPAAGGDASAALPAPCTLLTKEDVAPFFGTTALNANDRPADSNGRAACLFSLTVGSQGKSVSVATLRDYANNPGYVFPDASRGKVVANLGDSAVLEHPQQKVGQITVKLGSNAIVVYVEFYTDPVDDALLTTLARAAVARA